jgi:hypothetical protein
MAESKGEIQMSLRSSLNPEEQSNVIEGPTRFRTGPNKSALACAFCNRTYYVDDVIFHQAISALAEGLDNPFSCDECEADHEELSH